MPKAYRERHDATTYTMVADVVAAAKASAAACTWPKSLPRKRAASIMHRFAAAAIEYTEDHYDQVIQGPWVTLERGEGDCKSTAILIAAMCVAAGRSVKLRFAEYDDSQGRHYAHVFAVVDGQAVDPLLPIGEKYPYIRHLDIPL